MATHQKKPHGGKIKGASFGMKPGSGDAPGMGVKQKYPLTRGLPTKAVPLSGETSGYGANEYAGPSSARVGEVESDMASMLRNDGDDGEGVLDSLIHEGYSDRTGQPMPEDVASDFQTRKINTDPSANVPIHSGTKSASAGPKILNAPDFSAQSGMVRKP